MTGPEILVKPDLKIIWQKGHLENLFWLVDQWPWKIYSLQKEMYLHS